MERQRITNGQSIGNQQAINRQRIDNRSHRAHRGQRSPLCDRQRCTEPNQQAADRCQPFDGRGTASRVCESGVGAAGPLGPQDRCPILPTAQPCSHSRSPQEYHSCKHRSSQPHKTSRRHRRIHPAASWPRRVRAHPNGSLSSWPPLFFSSPTAVRPGPLGKSLEKSKETKKKSETECEGERCVWQLT